MSRTTAKRGTISVRVYSVSRKLLVAEGYAFKRQSRNIAEHRDSELALNLFIHAWKRTRGRLHSLSCRTFRFFVRSYKLRTSPRQLGAHSVSSPEYRNKKSSNNLRSLKLSYAWKRTRTSTPLRALVPETNVSTNFTIQAGTRSIIAYIRDRCQ